MHPLIAVTSGEPAGIGPELCLRLAEYDGEAHPVILGDRDLLAARAAQLGVDVGFRDYIAGQVQAVGRLDVLHIPLAVPSQAGRLDAANGPYVLSLLDRALAGCQSGEFAAMATAPVHKGVINAAGVHFTGHTEYLAEKTGTPLVVMMLAGETERGPLRVALATTHLPLKDVPAAITQEVLEKTLRILNADLRAKYGLAAPRILVAGLNPHAGEGGYLGMEEIEVITPVLDKLRGEGMALSGPYPADTMFTPPILAQGDAVLAMYHDQGLTALKYATFGKGINVTLGLPIIRTSVDHGTALELAGTGRADPGSLFESIAEAARMAKRSIQ
ncbi:4-hydroxythreonine-4-phosphate dehydrogenase PdxA [Ferribacterium limneticum]|uniref:4-hydroxythreonine-4-phosphate dehydrogenase PdxA n=1 Tax=Ferribacterium limneticum TaxID=76259 RepID=UPI001CFAFDD6|nr:4-hydroxythreonine-4-phosphate dehydrogenase PdxA [Ferribacterium limneticum]UCV27963.1 4-hydroxythreonine-4-phosphate dehydrogenase PdxA [Ferribacterium limneticum]UCV31880.1 4-hydroxythreonine-4-phosphate dehydrogenase PdxA [Ferribacterium limneticum]